MRQKLIKWLIEDIIPGAQQTKDPERSILKFSSAHNLAPAQVEMLGQLFNTAKTLSHLEKAAADKRGASFPTLDVPSMTAKYLELSAKPSTEWTGKSADVSLPACLKGWDSLDLGEEQEVKAAAVITEDDASIFSADRKAREARREMNIKQANLDTMKQAYSDFQVEGQKIMEDIHRTLRGNPNMSFPAFESDAISFYGDTSLPVMEKLAGYMEGSNWHVKRGARDDTKRLVPAYDGMMDKMGALIDWHYLSQAALGSIKQAMNAPGVEEPQVETAQFAEPAGENKKKDDRQGKGDAQQGDGGKGRDMNGGGGKDKSKGKGEGRDKSDSGKPREGYTAPINKTLDAVAGKGYGLLEPALQKAIGGGFNSNQQTVDRDYMDARHLATLQRLMTTDEVLAEADPEKVVSTYNTLREIAPSLAGDPNVMRVALRSAIQHDGISPFDIKSFLDTETARQKTDYNRQLREHIGYGGGEMGNRPA